MKKERLNLIKFLFRKKELSSEESLLFPSAPVHQLLPSPTVNASPSTAGQLVTMTQEEFNEALAASERRGQQRGQLLGEQRGQREERAKWEVIWNKTFNNA